MADTPQHNKDDDLLWLEVLAGRDVDDDTPAAREARVLRQVLLEEHEAASVQEAPDNGLERLLFRLKREGLLDEPAVDTSSAAAMASPRRSYRSAWMAVAAVVAISVGVTLFHDRGHDPEDDLATYGEIELAPMRGGDAGGQYLYVRNPKGLSNLMVKAFAKSGVKLAVTEAKGEYRVEGMLPTPVPGRLATLMGELRLSVPADGHLVVMVGEPLRLVP